MKQLIIIALCLFSMFSVQSIHAYAGNCKAGSNDAKVIRPEDVKDCEGVTDGSEFNIFYKLIRANVHFFLISCVLFSVGIIWSRRKKEPTKKERILIELFCWSPFVSIFFFVVIIFFINLM